MSTRLDCSRLTLVDALDLASLIELEARKRYTEFADSLGTRGVDFEELREEEDYDPNRPARDSFEVQRA